MTQLDELSPLRARLDQERKRRELRILVLQTVALALAFAGLLAASKLLLSGGCR